MTSSVGSKNFFIAVLFVLTSLGIGVSAMADDPDTNTYTIPGYDNDGNPVFDSDPNSADYQVSNLPSDPVPSPTIDELAAAFSSVGGTFQAAAAGATPLITLGAFNILQRWFVPVCATAGCANPPGVVLGVFLLNNPPNNTCPSATEIVMGGVRKINISGRIVARRFDGAQFYRLDNMVYPGNDFYGVPPGGGKYLIPPGDMCAVAGGITGGRRFFNNLVQAWIY